jgi:crotonobetainyl-CoA:carnitine CoA-transferase CaiB-like acyl-CoA transferase
MALQGVIAGLDLGEHRQAKGWHNPFNGIYPTSDNRYVVFSMINTKKEWPKLTAALGHPEWQQDPRFKDMRTLMKNRMELIELIRNATAKLTQQQLMTILDEHNITYGKINTMSDVINDEQIKANNIITETGDPLDDYQWTINSPINIQEESKRAPSRAPEVGQNSTEVLLELGLTEAEISKLKDQGIVTEQETP